MWFYKNLTEAGYGLRGFNMFLFFLLNPSQWRYLSTWKLGLLEKRLNPSLTSVDLGLPWFTYGAISWVKKNIKSDMKVFEYGTGGSTLFFLDRVSELVSVEHDSSWFEKINTLIKVEKHCKVSLILQQPERMRKNHSCEYRSSTFSIYKDYCFEKYVKSIETFPDKYFDVVVVDGRARQSCIDKALPKVKTGGYLVLDNSERRSYENAYNKMSRYRRKDFFGPGPLLPTVWKTTVWKIE